MLNNAEMFANTSYNKIPAVRRKKRRSFGSKLVRAGIIFLSFVLVTLLAATGVFSILRSKGKNTLYNESNNKGPNLADFIGIEESTKEDNLWQETEGTENNDSELEETISDAVTETQSDSMTETNFVIEETEAVSTEETTADETESATENQTAIVIETSTTDTGYEWQEGDVGYNGKIYRYNSEILTFLILGIDSDSEVPLNNGNINYIKGVQSDALFLAILNPKTREISLVAINRNTMTDIDVYDAANNFIRTTTAQICIQHGYGDGKHMSCERTKQTVSELMYSIPIHGYCSIRLGAIEELNDAVGGVEVTLPTDFPLLNLKAGTTIRLSGSQAYKFLQYRNRNEFDSATTRLNNEKVYLSAFAKQVYAATKQDLTFPVQLYQKLSKYLVTDLSLDEITYLASEFLSYSMENAKMYSIPGNTQMGTKFEEFYVDDKALIEMILEIFYDVVG